MAISKIILNGVTQMDLTADTVAANNLIAPNTAHGADGEAVVGTASQGITPTGTLNITENDTYDVTNYANAVVNVPSSGSSSWTKVAEKTCQISNYTSTTASTVETWATGHNELWTNEKIVYVRIRDTAGKRAGYYYGSDNIFIVPVLTASSNSMGVRICHRVSSSNEYANYSTVSTTGYGLFADALYSDGRLRLRVRYNSTYSLTINGTYKVEVYLLDPPTGAPIFT